MNPGLPEEQAFTLPEGTVTIGRTRDNEVQCLHKSLSRKHAEVRSDGVRVTVTDLESKNGLFFQGKRVARCVVAPGDSFRCGDIEFRLGGPGARGARAISRDPAQTLPSALALGPIVARPSGVDRPVVTDAPRPFDDDDARFQDKLFLLVRASELCVSDASLDALLDELVVIAAQALEADRVAVFTIDDVTAELRPRASRSFVGHPEQPCSRRVVDWVVGHGSPAAFGDVSSDRLLLGDAGADAEVRAAMCVPINPGKRTVGVMYVDSLTRRDCFRPDDLAFLRALANLAALALEGDALRRGPPRHATAPH